MLNGKDFTFDLTAGWVTFLNLDWHVAHVNALTRTDPRASPVKKHFTFLSSFSSCFRAASETMLLNKDFAFKKKASFLIFVCCYFGKYIQFYAFDKVGVDEQLKRTNKTQPFLKKTAFVLISFIICHHGCYLSQSYLRDCWEKVLCNSKMYYFYSYFCVCRVSPQLCSHCHI